jgi:hypothetical protein
MTALLRALAVLGADRKRRPNAAIDALGDTDWVPDIVIADQHLDHGDLGSATIAEARAYLGREVPGADRDRRSVGPIASIGHRRTRHRTDAQAGEAGATARAARASAGVTSH